MRGLDISSGQVSFYCATHIAGQRRRLTLARVIEKSNQARKVCELRRLRRCSSELVAVPVRVGRGHREIRAAINFGMRPDDMRLAAQKICLAGCQQAWEGLDNFGRVSVVRGPEVQVITATSGFDLNAKREKEGKS